MEAKNKQLVALDVTITGKAAAAVEVIRVITGKQEPVNVIISALRVYEWILAQQAKGYSIVSICPEGSQREDLKEKEVELVNYVKEEKRDLALKFFHNRDVFV